MQASSHDGREYWAKSYSGGPPDVTPLPPGFPGADYRPSSRRTARRAVQARRRREGLSPHRRGGRAGVRTGLRRTAGVTTGARTGPIEAVEGDRVRIYVTNRLPEPTTVHWHGMLLPNGMDGVAGLNQRIKAGGDRSTSSRCGSTGRSCTIPTSTR